MFLPTIKEVLNPCSDRYMSAPTPFMKALSAGKGKRWYALLPIEWATLIYTLFTTLLIVIFHHDIGAPWELLIQRCYVLEGMVLFLTLSVIWPCALTFSLRHIFPLTLLGYWYPDTYEFCQLLPNLDHFFARADAFFFHCQPSLEFARMLPQKVWSELFHLGYVSYYPLIALTVLYPLFAARERFARTAFIVLTAFFMYYTIYDLLPVAGPQYYFHAVGDSLITSGHYPHLGDYFRYHTDMARSPGPDGFFRSLVEATQQGGERPTAAFPSSHVGISTLLMILLWPCRRSLFVLALPFYLLICCATVYIQAHYLVDVFGGLVSSVVFYYLCAWLWNLFLRCDKAADTASE